MLHQYHPTGWTVEDLQWAREWFEDRYKLPHKLLHQYIRAVTRRLDRAVDGGHIPTRAQLAARDNKLVICGTPRTGSNMLMYALADGHPSAICAGEMYCPTNRDEEKAIINHARMLVAECNLFKLFVYRADKPEAMEAQRDGKILYLYRRDREAQYRSWVRGAKTGHWVKFPGVQFHETDRQTAPTRSEFEKIVDAAEKRWRDTADMVLAYEDMVENWDTTLIKIQEMVGWPIKLCPPVTLKQSK